MGDVLAACIRRDGQLERVDTKRGSPARARVEEERARAEMARTAAEAKARALAERPRALRLDPDSP